ncbi:MAG: prenyltransferase [Actinomycetota bacterium]|nr:prenyltransferase [Actinomycetota bacterium]
MGRKKIMFLETRPQFLLLTPVCVSVGFAAAVYEGYFNGLHLVLALIGALLAHISVNVLNDYFDYKRGTDLLTVKTPFSGGSGFLPKGLVKPEDAFKLGFGSLIIGLIIGAYFIYNYLVLLPIVALAAFLIYAYTPLLTKVGVTEVFPGLGFGPLMVIGAYVTQLPVGSFPISPTVILASIPVGILVSNLLFVNEIPDYDADLKTGRRHGVILLGKKMSSRAYVLFLALAYASIVIPVILNLLPPYVLLGLATIPIAVKASKGVLKNFDQTDKLVPSLGQNILVVLATPALVTIGFLIAAI